ncbi:hypothetical protein ACFL7M_06050 [Thermodesulfobacteriota bacterium]
MQGNKVNEQYEVLSPWADIDPVSVRGISPRLDDLSGKKIGLFASSKPVSKLILDAVEDELKERFPTSGISWYVATGRWALMQTETSDKERYEEWLKGVDAVIAAVGD